MRAATGASAKLAAAYSEYGHPSAAPQLSNDGQFKLGGDTTITGWTTVLSGVEYFDTTGFGGSPAGRWAVDLANYTYQTGGGIEQAAQTVAGSTYDVSFLAGNSLSSGRDGTGIIKVSIDGGASTSFATAAANSGQMAWETRTFRFVAAGSTSTLRFWNDPNPFLHFAVIDGTSVVEHITTTPPVPEPQTWAPLLCGLSVLGATRARR